MFEIDKSNSNPFAYAISSVYNSKTQVFVVL